MSKKVKKILIWFTALIIILFSLYTYLGYKGYLTKYTEYRLKQTSEPIIEKIEAYKIKNGFYPKKISDVGYPEPDESGPIFYELKDSYYYKIICPIGFEYIYYDSKTKKWYP